ncbi:Paraquat-inducible protein B [Granulibacter bethesdensis]|uniref:PqiB family protein n=1 Tax=Granulibacter bethesdensis TaxID=364410 RepID=UPI00090C2C19|nr:MlaD family protein [Granulibacter bethesdensis]APH55972.1 Paraquat-inducible protein B [Granulibacter bethesdensis]
MSNNERPPLPPEDDDGLDYPQGLPRRRFSLIWLVPILAAICVIWIGYRTISQEGPTITLTFQTGEGLVAGQTKVRHKAVDLGTVQSINLSNDMSHVVVTIAMRQEAENVLTDHARFWVVRPRLSAGDISGLETIVSGAFIELDPGRPGGNYRYQFTGLEAPPAVRSDEPGKTFTLKAFRVGQIGTGAPVFFRDRPVGEVLSLDVGKPGESGTMTIFIRAPFDQYVHEGSFFWSASGMSVSTSGGDFRVEIESLQALLSGAVAFDTPNEALETPEATDKTNFFLFRDQDTASSSHYHEQLKFVTYLKGDLSGLDKYAPVLIYGIRVGFVTDVHLGFDSKSNTVIVPVHFVVQPERLKIKGPPVSKEESEARLAALVRHGLRAKLATTSYITGAQAIELVMDENGQDSVLMREGDAVVLQQATGTDFAGLTASVGAIAAKLNAIPFAEIGANLNQTLEGVAAIAKGEQLRNTLRDVSKTMASVRELADNANKGATPLLRRLPQISQDLQSTLSRANTLVGSLDNGYGANSHFNRELDRLMAQLNDTARSIRILADLLDRHPEALILGRAKAGEH